MGYTITRARECGTRYTAYYRDIRGKIRSAGTLTTERKADRAWQAAEAAQAVGRVSDPRRGRQRFRVYASEVWFPNHLLERSTRQNYTYLYDRYIAPFFGDLKMVEIMPSDVREWVVRLQADGVRPPTIKQCKVILDAILTTALNDQITFLHAGKGVRTPAVAKKVRRIITTQQFDRLLEAVRDETMRLLIETGIETGMRWGELSELRPADLDLATGVFTVRRAVVELNPKFHPHGERFLVKDYPKDSEWREIKISSQLLQTLNAYIRERGLGVDDLLFTHYGSAAQRVAVPPSRIASGVTEPNEHPSCRPRRRYRQSSGRRS